MNDSAIKYAYIWLICELLWMCQGVNVLGESLRQGFIIIHK